MVLAFGLPAGTAWSCSGVRPSSCLSRLPWSCLSPPWMNSSAVIMNAPSVWACQSYRLRNRHVPEDGCGELENTLDALSEGRRLEPFAPRNVRHLVEGDALNIVGNLLALRLIGRAHPVVGELLEPRDVGPAGPGS